jgi:cytochrome c
MKHLITTVLFSGLLSLQAQEASATVSAEPLAKANNCLMCHGVSAAVLGPAYKDVAKKYKGDASAEEKLIAKVKAGGSGVWGKMPMPANSPQVKDEDIKTIVKWILTL